MIKKKFNFNKINFNKINFNKINFNKINKYFPKKNFFVIINSNKRTFLNRGYKSLYTSLGKYDKAKQYILKALKTHLQLNHITFETFLRIDYANCLNNLMEPRLSIEQTNIAIELLKKVENNNVPKVMLLILFTNIFFSVKGSNNKPINIIIGSFTESHIGIYVGSGFLENIHLPNVKVQTLLK